MNKTNLKKLTMAAVLVAVCVACSPFYIPVGASKCFPIQHLVNILAGCFLGPWYATGMAFCTSLIRVLAGTGSLLAFPGSMFGALLVGLVYRYTKLLPLAYAAEPIGTGIIGAMAAYPVASFLMGKEAALFTYVIPFIVSSLGGAVIAVFLVTALKKTGVVDLMLGNPVKAH
jgi:energy coupling factor transporter S component ThiW